MNEPADQPTRVMVPPSPPGIPRRVLRRRPSGEPPPLPRQLQTSGVGWLIATVVLVAVAMLVLGGGLRGVAVAVTVADNAVVAWLAQLDVPGRYAEHSPDLPI